MVFAGLLANVAGKTLDQKFRAELRENTGVLKDRATQLKILVNVKSHGERKKNNFVGGDVTSQVGQAAMGLRQKVKEVLDLLAIGNYPFPPPPFSLPVHYLRVSIYAASLQKRLADTINQLAAIKRVMSVLSRKTKSM